MTEYISSFITGFGSVIGAAMAQTLPGAKILNVYDGLVHYSYAGNARNIHRLSFFNNSFLVYKVYRGNSLSFDKMVAQASIPESIDKKPRTFRVRFSRENQFVKVGKETAFAAEKEISKKTRWKVDRVHPQSEFWFILRSERVGFLGLLRASERRQRQPCIRAN